MKKMFSRLSLRVVVRLIWFFSRIVPYRLGVWAGGCIGLMAFYALRRERNRALQHIASVYQTEGDAWAHKTARRSFIHLGKALLEIMLMTQERLAETIAFVGYENLQKAISMGRGVVYVTGHIGNWELMGSAIATMNPLSVVAAPLEPEEVNEQLVRLRAGLGVRTILRSRPGASRELIRVFKENRTLGILIDQDTDVDGAFVDFMGKPAWTPTAAASMAIKFNAPVVYGYVHRGADNRHTIFIEGPLELIRTGNVEHDIVSNTALFTKKIEDSIRAHPEQWVWMHRRWRRQP